MKSIAASLLAVALLSCPLMSHAALIAVDGGWLVDDLDANLIWVSDANLMATEVDASGNVAAFVNAIINASGGTITSAQGTHTLTTDDFVTADGINTKRGQMTWYGAQAWVHWHLFYGEIGQVLDQPITVTHNGGFVLFNVQDFAYWSGTEYGPNVGAAWTYHSNSGF